MPNCNIIDTHLHLWDPAYLRYRWLANIPLLNRPYLLDDYRRACGPLAVEKMIFIQCECDSAQYRQEAEWVAGLATQDPRIAGIVPWAPLEKGRAARPEIESLAANPLVKGVRRIIQFESDPDFCLQPGFIEGVSLLADYNLHFEICIKGDRQFRNTLTLVRKCPRTRFILDHIGKPFIKDAVLEPWASMLKELAALPNAWCKMSGLATEADHADWKKEQLKPYIDVVMEHFGFQRVMFGGDWPVAAQATAYPRWVETLEWALAGASPEQLKKLFRDNAACFYRLSDNSKNAGVDLR